MTSRPLSSPELRVLTALCFAVCGCASQASPSDSDALEGPGKTITPVASGAECTLSNPRPVAATADMKFESLWVKPLDVAPSESREVPLASGATVKLTVCHASVRSSLGSSEVRGAAGAVVDVSPIYVGVASALPAVESLTYSAFPSVALYSYDQDDPSVTQAVSVGQWLGLPRGELTRFRESEAVSFGRTFTLDLPSGFVSGDGSSGLVDLAPYMAKVVFEFDDLDPAFPTAVPLPIQSHDSLGAGRNEVRRWDVRTLAKGFLAAPGRRFYFREGPEMVIGAAGTTTTFSLGRLNVDHMQYNTKSLAGTFEVTDDSGRQWIKGAPTRTGVDLPRGKYTVKITATGSDAVTRYDVQSVTL